MLNRHNSMSSIHHHQPIMPFKWRPFDMYNDVHVNDTHTSSHKQHRQLKNDRCECEFNRLQSHVDQHHATICDGDVNEHPRQRWQRHRQSSRGSSSSSGGSSGSCASISTVNRYFVNDIDNSESNRDSTIVSCESIDCFCCKLDGQRMSNNLNDKSSKSAKQQQQQQCDRQSDCTKCYNVKCCTPNCPKISSHYTKMVSNNGIDTSSKNNNGNGLANRVVVMPFDGIDYTYKCEQSMIGTLNHCESPSLMTTPTTKISAKSIGSPSIGHCMKMSHHCSHAGYVDSNWMIGHKKQRPSADTTSKYTIFHMTHARCFVQLFSNKNISGIKFALIFDRRQAVLKLDMLWENLQNYADELWNSKLKSRSHPILGWRKAKNCLTRQSAIECC